VNFFVSGLKLPIGTNQPVTVTTTSTSTVTTPTTPGGTRLQMFKNFFKYGSSCYVTHFNSVLYCRLLNHRSVVVFPICLSNHNWMIQYFELITLLKLFILLHEVYNIV
jgi:hypothetical protein